MTHRIFAAAIAAAALLAGPAVAQETPSSPGAVVYFVNIEDGATVSSPVKVIFGLSGMGVAPAGVEKDGTGHHHLFLNRAAFGDVDGDLSEVMEATETQLHFGGGQTETMLELEPGEHTLQLVLGDWSHVPHDPPVVSQQITITVE